MAPALSACLKKKLKGEWGTVPYDNYAPAFPGPQSATDFADAQDAINRGLVPLFDPADFGLVSPGAQAGSTGGFSGSVGGGGGSPAFPGSDDNPGIFRRAVGGVANAFGTVLRGVGRVATNASISAGTQVGGAVGYRLGQEILGFGNQFSNSVLDAGDRQATANAGAGSGQTPTTGRSSGFSSAGLLLIAIVVVAFFVLKK